jgi:hypothetical protein
MTFTNEFHAVITGGIWVYKVEKEHNEHLDHLRAENGGTLTQPPNYEYLNRRVKPFPWGMNSLFFNPEVHALFTTLECRLIESLDAGEQRFGDPGVDFFASNIHNCHRTSREMSPIGMIVEVHRLPCTCYSQRSIPWAVMPSLLCQLYNRWSRHHD